MTTADPAPRPENGTELDRSPGQQSSGDDFSQAHQAAVGLFKARLFTAFFQHVADRQHPDVMSPQERFVAHRVSSPKLYKLCIAADFITGVLAVVFAFLILGLAGWNLFDPFAH